MSRTPRKKNEKRFTFSLPEEDLATLERLAQEKDRTTAYVVREAVAKYISAEGRGEVQLPLELNQNVVPGRHLETGSR